MLVSIPFQRALVQCEMQTILCSIWPCVTVPISYDNSHYTRSTASYPHYILIVWHIYIGWLVSWVSWHLNDIYIGCLYRLIYVYMYVVNSISLQTFWTGIYNCRRLLKIHYVISLHLIRWLTNINDFSFKWTATAAIGIHSTKTWLSQLVNFKNAIWTWERTICNKILF